MRAILLLCLTPLALGCGSGAPEPAKTESSGDAVTHSAHDHSGWWCVEHGVPEEVCGLCNTKLAAEMQKKGDWCRDHDRPDSQCFVCHPELEAQFAAQYEAKHGKQPPKPEG
jgi:cobalt-zinc-cadmium efflux system membrane fusion protein